jgi:hypothetical protein
MEPIYSYLFVAIFIICIISGIIKIIKMPKKHRLKVITLFLGVITAIAIIVLLAIQLHNIMS